MNKLLEKCKEIQIIHPDVLIAGSCALKIYKVDLFRPLSDIDLIVGQIIELGGEILEYSSFKGDFHRTEQLGDIKIEQCTGDTREFEIIEYEGFEFKLQKLEQIIKIKAEYALKGVNKHRNDLYQMLSLPRPKQIGEKETEIINDFPIY